MYSNLSICFKTWYIKNNKTKLYPLNACDISHTLLYISASGISILFLLYSLDFILFESVLKIIRPERCCVRILKIVFSIRGMEPIVESYMPFGYI